LKIEAAIFFPGTKGVEGYYHLGGALTVPPKTQVAQDTVYGWQRANGTLTR